MARKRYAALLTALCMTVSSALCNLPQVYAGPEPEEPALYVIPIEASAYEAYRQIGDEALWNGGNGALDGDDLPYTGLMDLAECWDEETWTGEDSCYASDAEENEEGYAATVGVSGYFLIETNEGCEDGYHHEDGANGNMIVIPDHVGSTPVRGVIFRTNYEYDWDARIYTKKIPICAAGISVPAGVEVLLAGCFDNDTAAKDDAFVLTGAGRVEFGRDVGRVCVDAVVTGDSSSSDLSVAMEVSWTDVEGLDASKWGSLTLGEGGNIRVDGALTLDHLALNGDRNFEVAYDAAHLPRLNNVPAEFPEQLEYERIEDEDGEEQLYEKYYVTAEVERTDAEGNPETDAEGNPLTEEEDIYYAKVDGQYYRIDWSEEEDWHFVEEDGGKVEYDGDLGEIHRAAHQAYMAFSFYTEGGDEREFAAGEQALVFSSKEVAYGLIDHVAVAMQGHYDVDLNGRFLTEDAPLELSVFSGDGAKAVYEALYEKDFEEQDERIDQKRFNDAVTAVEYMKLHATDPEKNSSGYYNLIVRRDHAERFEPLDLKTGGSGVKGLLVEVWENENEDANENGERPLCEFGGFASVTLGFGQDLKLTMENPCEKGAEDFTVHGEGTLTFENMSTKNAVIADPETTVVLRNGAAFRSLTAGTLRVQNGCYRLCIVEELNAGKFVVEKIQYNDCHDLVLYQGSKAVISDIDLKKDTYMYEDEDGVEHEGYSGRMNVYLERNADTNALPGLTISGGVNADKIYNEYMGTDVELDLFIIPFNTPEGVSTDTEDRYAIDYDVTENSDFWDCRCYTDEIGKQLFRISKDMCPSALIVVPMLVRGQERGRYLMFTPRTVKVENGEKRYYASYEDLADEANGYPLVLSDMYAAVDLPLVDLAGLTVAPVADQTYTGSPITPAVTVKNGSTTLTAGTHYTLSYRNNTDVGTASITITAKDGSGYMGTKTVNFTIKSASSGSPAPDVPAQSNPTPAAPNTTTETKPDGTKVETTTETKPDGTKSETVTETKPDGTKSETVTETKTDGTKTETVTETKTDGSKIESVTETKPDGSSTKTETETKKNGTITETKVQKNADGTKVESESVTKKNGSKTESVVEKDKNGEVVKTTDTVTKADGSATEKVMEKAENSKGKETSVTTTTKTDKNGEVTSVVEKTEIPQSTATTSTTVTVKKDGNEKVMSAAAKVENTVAKGNTATLTVSVASQITEAAGTKRVDVTMTVKDETGATMFKVQVNTQDLKKGNDLYIYKKDAKTGKYTMVNAKTYNVNANGGVSVSMGQKGTYELVSGNESKKITNEIKKTIVPKKASANVAPGKNTSFALSAKADKKNIQKITYTTGNAAVVSVDKNGKITAKGKGTVTVKAKITLKNGAAKTVKMKIQVK